MGLRIRANKAIVLSVTVAAAPFFARAAEWTFETDWGTYQLTSPTDASVQVTNDGQAGVITNTTAFTFGHKVITFPPDAGGNYTAAFVYDKAEAPQNPSHGSGAAKYVEKQRDDVNWGPPQDIGAAFPEVGSGKALNGYLAADGLYNVYLAYTDKNTDAAVVAKKAGPGLWTAAASRDVALAARYNGTRNADMSGYSLTSAYGTADYLGISSTRAEYPTGRAIPSWSNVRRGPSGWDPQPYLHHGLEFQSRSRYSGVCTIAEDGTLYVSYETYRPEYPPAGWYLPALPPRPGGTGVFVIPPARAALEIHPMAACAYKDIGYIHYTSAAPYIDYDTYPEPPKPVWHLGYAHGHSAEPYHGLRHIWKGVEPFGASEWTGDVQLRRLAPSTPARYNYGYPNVTSYYDAANGFTYLIYVYTVFDKRTISGINPDGRVYLDVVKFDPSQPPGSEDALIFYPGQERGFEVAGRTKTAAFYPQVTVDKGSDASFDIIIAWTEGDNFAKTSDGPYFPNDGDIFYRQFTLTFLGP